MPGLLATKARICVDPSNACTRKSVRCRGRMKREEEKRRLSARRRRSLTREVKNRREAASNSAFELLEVLLL